MPERLDGLSPDGILDYYSTADQSSLRDNTDLGELDKRLNDEFDRGYDIRISEERNWEIYRSYLKGDQQVYRNPNTGDVVRLAGEDSTQLKSQHNILRPTARSLVGKLTRSNIWRQWSICRGLVMLFFSWYGTLKAGVR